jgi:hypothetical protein
MENVYTSYTRKIASTTYYFVKRFVVFSDLKDVPPILDGYGMHTDFENACTIAGIKDIEIKNQLLSGIENGQRQAKVIDLNDMSFLSPKAAGI